MHLIPVPISVIQAAFVDASWSTSSSMIYVACMIAWWGNAQRVDIEQRPSSARCLRSIWRDGTASHHILIPTLHPFRYLYVIVLDTREVYLTLGSRKGLSRTRVLPWPNPIFSFATEMELVLLLTAILQWISHLGHAQARKEIGIIIS